MSQRNGVAPSETVLIVSDNPELTLFVKKEIESIQFEHPLRIDYRYSSNNKRPQSMIDVGAKEIDLQDSQTVKTVVKEYDLVLSLHCKQIFPKELVESICCINFHPGFNPHNRGWFPQAFSIINGLPVGATIHLMDADIDHGDIVDQAEVSIDIGDTSLEVYRKIIEKEKELIRKNIFSIVEGIFTTFSPSSEGNYNGIEDYKNLCKLDLSNVSSLREHINLLRATSHGAFKNAYFTDAVGKQYFVRIHIEEEHFKGNSDQLHCSNA